MFSQSIFSVNSNCFWVFESFHEKILKHGHEAETKKKKYMPEELECTFGGVWNGRGLWVFML